MERAGVLYDAEETALKNGEGNSKGVMCVCVKEMDAYEKGSEINIATISADLVYILAPISTSKHC